MCSTQPNPVCPGLSMSYYVPLFEAGHLQGQSIRLAVPSKLDRWQLSRHRSRIRRYSSMQPHDKAFSRQCTLAENGTVFAGLGSVLRESRKSSVLMLRDSMVWRPTGCVRLRA